ncbi:PEP-CTERM sorting domain-containing protein [Rubritalea sp.]|uniref:PEP-CTERM sorting domain-containing protein n=1 Tax=Rubritalea sp. TaxID=2109375 RepID=UPI003EF130B7
MSEAGGDTVINIFGSIDTSSLTVTSDAFDSAWTDGFFFQDGVSYLQNNPSSSNANWDFFAFDGATTGALGTGTGTLIGVTSGTRLVLHANGTGSDGIFLDSSYVSGSAINSTITFTGTSASTLGLDSGTDFAGTLANGDTIGSVAAVPEPSSTALLGLGSLGLILRRRR